MRPYGTPIVLDLQAQGGASVTPGATTQLVTFKPTRLAQIIGGKNWPGVRNVGVSTRIGFDQAAAGGSAVNQDELYRVMESYNGTCPHLGTVFNKDVFTGPVAKHIVEFFSAGYCVDRARAQIPSTDGDTACELYQDLPFTNEAFVRPMDFWPWVGELRDFALDVRIATSTTIAAVSTGAVTEAPCSVRAWFEMYPQKVPQIHALSFWRQYTQAASSGVKTFLLQNVGSSDGLNGFTDGCRISTLVELMNVLGFGGASTADIYTGFTCPDLGQDNTANVDVFVKAFRMLTGHAGPISGLAAANIALHDGAGNPYTMAATPNLLLNDATLGYLMWRFPGMPTVLNNIKRWGVAPLLLSRDFSAVPSSGTYRAITNELKHMGGDINSGKVGETLDLMQLDQGVREKIRAAVNNREFCGAVKIPTQ